jgi:hypothetical protein
MLVFKHRRGRAMFKNIQKLNWIKQGLIYCADGSLPWAHSHAFPPIPHLVSPDRLRIFIGSCDTELVSRACYVDVLLTLILECGCRL